LPAPPAPGRAGTGYGLVLASSTFVHLLQSGENRHRIGLTAALDPRKPRTPPTCRRHHARMSPSPEMLRCGQADLCPQSAGNDLAGHVSTVVGCVAGDSRGIPAFPGMTAAPCSRIPLGTRTAITGRCGEPTGAADLENRTSDPIEPAYRRAEVLRASRPGRDISRVTCTVAQNSNAESRHCLGVSRGGLEFRRQHACNDPRHGHTPSGSPLRGYAESRERDTTSRIVRPSGFHSRKMEPAIVAAPWSAPTYCRSLPAPPALQG